MSLTNYKVIKLSHGDNIGKKKDDCIESETCLGKKIRYMSAMGRIALLIEVISMEFTFRAGSQVPYLIMDFKSKIQRSYFVT